MGLRGPAPKPTELKKLEGTYRKDRVAPNEPQPRVIAVECPEWIEGVARQEYERLAEVLIRTRVLAETDWVALAAFANEFDGWYRATRLIRKEGSILTSKAGGKYVNPRVGIASMHFKNMVKLMTELGLTPASRTRISAMPPDDAPQSLAEKLFAAVGHNE